MTLHLTNARIPGDRGLLGNLINIAVDNGVVTALDVIGQTSSIKLPSSTRAALLAKGDESVMEGGIINALRRSTKTQTVIGNV